METKPVLGLRPRWLVEEQRLIEVTEAVSRYLEAKIPVPPSWLEELVYLVSRTRAIRAV